MHLSLSHQIENGANRLRGATIAAALALTAVFSSASLAQSLPDTQAEIEAEILKAKRAGGGKVVVAPGIITIYELRVPSTVTLAGSGPLGSHQTTLRLRARSDGGLVTLGGGSLGKSSRIQIENLVLDGNRQNQSPDRYITVDGRSQPVARPAVLTFNCTSCSGRHLKVINAMYDGVQVSVSQNVTITDSSASNVGRGGFIVTSTSNTVKIHKSSAEKTGVAWTYVGGGPGFGPGGRNVELRYVTTNNTNGDGVAGYTSSNLDIKVIDSVFRGSRNHCVHLGGDRAVIQRNKCYSPRLVGYYLANDFRPGAIDERDAVGGRILSNYVENAGSDGIKVQWYVSDTYVVANNVFRTFNSNYAISDSRGVIVTDNTGRWPGYGRNPSSPHCHLQIVNSRVSHARNDFSYTGRTRPPVC
jgi:hypothetical protein